MLYFWFIFGGGLGLGVWGGIGKFLGGKVGGEEGGNYVRWGGLRSEVL